MSKYDISLSALNGWRGDKQPSLRLLKVLHTNNTLRGPRPWIQHSKKIPKQSRKKDQSRNRLSVPPATRGETPHLSKIRDDWRQGEKTLHANRDRKSLL